MKKIVLLIALAGFTAAGSYAQDKGTHVIEIHKRVKAAPPCFMLKKENLGIPGCVDMDYSSSNAYFGNYTGRPTVTNKMIKPQTAAATKPAKPAETAWFKKVGLQFRPCYTYNQNGVVVKSCPGEFYDNEKEPLLYAPVMMSSMSTYMGYYPVDDETKAIKDPNKPENWTPEKRHYPKTDQNFLGEYKDQ